MSYTYQTIETIKKYCESTNTPSAFIQVDTLQKAKTLPCVFNNWAIFYKGNFETVNLADLNTIKRILNK